MPLKPKKPCGKRGCVELIRDGYFCEVHQQEYDRQLQARRGSSRKRGYNYTWEKVRAIYARKHPICEDPFVIHLTPVPMDEVDHIIPIKQGGTNRNDNLQSLCKRCHARKTKEDEKKYKGRGVNYP